MSVALAAQYLELELTSPVIVGACPLTIEPEAVRQHQCYALGMFAVDCRVKRLIAFYEVYAKRVRKTFSRNPACWRRLTRL